MYCSGLFTIDVYSVYPVVPGLSSLNADSLNFMKEQFMSRLFCYNSFPANSLYIEILKVISYIAKHRMLLPSHSKMLPLHLTIPVI